MDAVKRGIDYAYSSGPVNFTALKAAGIGFICRYLSRDPAKNITAREWNDALAVGLDVVLIWEDSATAALGGYPQGVQDAGEASALISEVAPGALMPVYFAVDWDAGLSDQPAIDEYLKGAKSVLINHPIGMYGGYWPLSRAFNAGVITYGWQTASWSGNNIDPRAHIYQDFIGETFLGMSADGDEAFMEDFGQWPRPATTPVTPTAGTQKGWRHCDNCACLYWSGHSTGMACAAGGTHQTTSSEYIYSLPWTLA